jgi:type I restriction enzyme S subunit
MSNLNQGVLGNIPFMLPPYEEQKRILNEAKRWFSLIDILKENQVDLFDLIDEAKKKILNLAIHGELVPQNQDDTPAIDFLKRINPNVDIPCDNPHYPFDIPKSWCWVYGSQVFAPMQSCTPNGETFKYIDIDTIDNKNNSILSAKILPTKDAPSRASRFTMKDDTLFSMVRPYLRNIAMVKEDDCIASTGFYVCRSNGSLLPKYCFYMMNFFMKGDNSPSINRSHIESFIYPLPPLVEQKRIVAEIDRYFRALDKIKESLTA